MNTTNMTLATLLARLEALESSSVTVEAHTESVNALWVLCAAYGVHAGCTRGAWPGES